MIYRFGNFELDEGARELRLNGIEFPLQPRVFDLLRVLNRNRDRVVSKDELMSELWPRVIVGEGSLQRAVSLARSALKQGGLGDAIRSYTRQGYRLCIDEAGAPEDVQPRASLSSARAAYEKGEWDTAILEFESADAEAALDALDLECLADAEQSAGRADDAEPVLERAAAAFAAKGDSRGTARVMLRLAEIVFETGRMAVARGWLARAQRYLHGREESWEHGFEAYVAARIAVATGDPQGAVEHGRRGLAVAERIGSEEIEGLARIYTGYGEIALGNVSEGTKLVDEAAATVLSGNVGRRAGGVIYCGLIWLCCNRGDWQRAAQWGDSFDRWCEREGMTRFTGLCQLHRAEVLSISGDAKQAEQELHVACDQLASFSPFAAGDAFRVLGELQLMRGELEKAETAFRRAHDLGWDPQPGLSMLQAERGEWRAAVSGLARSLDDRNWALQQRRGLLLAAMVVVAARSGDREHAVNAMRELDERPELWATEYISGAVSRARAELALLQAARGEAITAMRVAIRSWQAAHATLNQAICRHRLAEILADEGDAASARLELRAALASFESQHAPVRAKACAELLGRLAVPDRLSLR